MPKPFHKIDENKKIADIRVRVEDFMAQGLSEAQVGEKQRQFGLNTIEQEKGIRILSIFLQQFASPLIYILIIAAAITIFLGDFVDTAVIGLAVVVNTILGFYQEFKAQRALAALRSLLSPKATVIRHGERQVIDASDVVPGDVCLVGLGERIPADGILVSANDFSLNEAILTGESAPVSKKAYTQWLFDPTEISRIDGAWQELDTVHKTFAGTTVSSGDGVVVVKSIGSETEIGKIAKSLRETQEAQTPLQKRIGRLSNQLAVFVGVIAVVIFVTGILAGESFLTIFTTSVAIAVAAIPEGLAVSLTVILALGMQRILKRKALVRKLVSAETLGSVTVICSDKTGTLTEGVMRVTKAEFVDEQGGIEAAILANDRRDPLEIAMWNWVVDEKKQDPRRIVDVRRKLDTIPFSPEEKFSAKLFDNGVYVLGAPEVVLSFCSLPGSGKQNWLLKIEEYGKKGLRIVGLARRKRRKGERKLVYKNIKTGLQFLGILVYEDPVREGVREALSDAKKAGIKVKVITGDYRATAESVIGQLGLMTQEQKLGSTFPMVMDGDELERLSIDELQGRVEHAVLFARINPVQKLKIVEALQANGEVVAMTGDGVNDAPALKRADIGVVVSGATDVAKETADIILLDDNFATIVAAVEEGRGIFQNLRKVILYLLSDAFSEVILVMASLLLRFPLPITAAQILWINLVDDGFPNLALTADPKESGLLRQPPRRLDEPLIDQEIKTLILLISFSSAMVVLIVFFLYLQWTTIEYARTMAFTVLAINTLLYVFSTRSLRTPIWREGVFANKWLIWTVLGGLALQIMAIYLPALQEAFKTIPLTFFDWIVVLLSSMVVIGIIEFIKWWFMRRTDKFITDTV